MKVLETVDGPAARAAVVHACPDEIAGMDPAVPNGYSVLIETSNRLSRVPARGKREAVAVARQCAATAQKLPASAQVFLDVALPGP
jgi:hypothetical protein